MTLSLNEITLDELLCIKVFSETFQMAGPDECAQSITEWAEREVMAGAESDTLLILASLNLDPIPDRNEVEKYLLLYQREKNIQNPQPVYSALVWLRLKLGRLLTASSSSEVESRLAFFTHYFLDYPPKAFARIASVISHFYWELYDEAIPVFNSRASEMDDKELMAHVRERLLPFYRILNHPDWVHLLAR